MAGMEHILQIDEAGWVRLVLNRPEARNALNTAVLGALATRLAVLASDPACRAVLVYGAEGNFAAGADIGEIEHKSSAEGAVDPRKGHWAVVREFPKPLVAAVDGFALGGGLELALMADLLVVGGTARLGLPETSLGLIPGAGGGQRLLVRVGPARAARMVLLGEIVDAEQAFGMGLASHMVTGSAVDEGALLAAKLAGRAPLAMIAAKRALVEGAEAGLALAAERLAFEGLLDSADKAEGIGAFRGKRKPQFRGE